MGTVTASMFAKIAVGLVSGGAGCVISLERQDGLVGRRGLEVVSGGVGGDALVGRVGSEVPGDVAVRGGGYLRRRRAFRCQSRRRTSQKSWN